MEIYIERGKIYIELDDMWIYKSLEITSEGEVILKMLCPDDLIPFFLECLKDRLIHFNFDTSTIKYRGEEIGRYTSNHFYLNLSKLQSFGKKLRLSNM